MVQQRKKYDIRNIALGDVSKHSGLSADLPVSDESQFSCHCVIVLSFSLQICLVLLERSSRGKYGL